MKIDTGLLNFNIVFMFIAACVDSTTMIKL